VTVPGADDTRAGSLRRLLLAALWLAATLWVRALALPDEGRYAGVAWEMLRSGNWLVPTLDGLPYFHKPPLFYWVTAGAMSLFGTTEWAARIAPYLGGVAACAALYGFAARWAGKPIARTALIVLATQPLFFVGAQYANLDMLVAGCIAVTIAASAHAVLGAIQGRQSRRAIALAWAFAALGLLAKGLIGIVLPGMVVVAWLLALRRPGLLLALLWWPAIVLFLAIAAPWFVAMQLRFPQFADYFFIVQHFKRFAQAGFNNAQPFWFYPVVLSVLTFPWIFWLPAAARRGYWADAQLGPLRKLMWLWLGLVTLFFSLPQSKLVGYILPVAAPLAFLLGDGIASRIAGSPRVRRLWQASVGLAVIVCVAAVVAGGYKQPKSFRVLAQQIAVRIAPGDQVLFLQDYFFDVPIYARLASPVLVAEDWQSPEVDRHDNWIKELRDAQRFADADAARVLVTPAQVPAILCGAGTTWVMGHASMPGRYPALAQAEQIGQSGETILWRIERRRGAAVNAAACPGMPSVSSAGKS
jgi:4-amino-4-deoxy-L-arabinose transferase-like glycosyltransferase